jgi:predicted kinase
VDLPGTGKTTVARTLARRLKAVHVRVDTIEQALRSSDVLKGDVVPAGYVVASTRRVLAWTNWSQL